MNKRIYLFKYIKTKDFSSVKDVVKGKMIEKIFVSKPRKYSYPKYKEVMTINKAKNLIGNEQNKGTIDKKYNPKDARGC